MSDIDLNGLGEIRQHLVDTLVSFGRTAEGAARQVADFEAAIRKDMPPPSAGKRIQERIRRGTASS